MYEILATAFAFIFLDLDSTKSFGLRAAAAQGVQKLSAVVRDVCKAIKADYLATSLKGFLGLGNKDHILGDYGIHMIQRLFEGGNSVDEVVSTILPTAPTAIATQSQCVGIPGWLKALICSRTGLANTTSVCTITRLLSV